MQDSQDMHCPGGGAHPQFSHDPPRSGWRDTDGSFRAALRRHAACRAASASIIAEKGRAGVGRTRIRPRICIRPRIWSGIRIGRRCLEPRDSCDVLTTKRQWATRT
jgi:hypothetical protein